MIAKEKALITEGCAAMVKIDLNAEQQKAIERAVHTGLVATIQEVERIHPEITGMLLRVTLARIFNEAVIYDGRGLTLDKQKLEAIFRD